MERMYGWRVLQARQSRGYERTMESWLTRGLARREPLVCCARWERCSSRGAQAPERCIRLIRRRREARSLRCQVVWAALRLESDMMANVFGRLMLVHSARYQSSL